MRVVTIFDTQTNDRRTVSSNASTWGQLKTELRVESSMKAVLREGRQTLENSEAVLPEGEFTIFLFPNKVKSGVIDYREMIQDLKEEVTAAFDSILENFDEGVYGEPSTSSGDDLEDEAARIASEMRS